MESYELCSANRLLKKGRHLIEITNDKNEVADAFSDVDLDRHEPPLQRGGSLRWLNKIKELYDTARRTALGSEKLLNSFITELEDDLRF